MMTTCIEKKLWLEYMNVSLSASNEELVLRDDYRVNYYLTDNAKVLTVFGKYYQEDCWLQLLRGIY